MLRHLAFTLGIVILAATTVLVMADAGVFDAAGEWLFQRYAAESLLADGRAAWPWLLPVTVILAAGLVAWVAVEPVSWPARCGVLAVAALTTVFLSLTLALYGLAFNPFPALVAAGAGFLMGGVLAETPGSRRQREWGALLGSRVAPSTLAAWKDQPEEAPWSRPAVRETAVLALRLLDPLPAPDHAADRLAQMTSLLDECAALLKKRPGVVLDPSVTDGVRAFFGQVPLAPLGGVEAAAEAALELTTYLREDATLRQQGGQPVLACGLGLSLGPLLVGRHGGPAAPAWTASGPAAEQARQLAGLNARHRTTVLAGRRAAAALRERFELASVDGEAIQSLLGRKEEAPSIDLPDEPIDLLESEPAAAPAPAPKRSAPTPVRRPVPPAEN